MSEKKQTPENQPQKSGDKKQRRRGGSQPGALAHNKKGPYLAAMEDVQPGDNARYIRYALASWDLPPIDISDPEQVQARILQYFQFCADNDRKPQIIGMANWLGVSRATINEWKKGNVRSGTHFDIIQKAVSLLEEQWIEYMQNGKINPAAGIFLAKNWYGYKDTQDVVVTPQAPYESGSPEDVAKKYVEGMVGYETVDGDGTVE